MNRKFLLTVPALAIAILAANWNPKGGGHESMFKKMGTTDPKACTEACMKMAGSKYVLFNGASKGFYQLDDQKKPQPFAGQKVQVTGTLDKATKTIHVTDIKAG